MAALSKLKYIKAPTYKVFKMIVEVFESQMYKPRLDHVQMRSVQWRATNEWEDFGPFMIFANDAKVTVDTSKNGKGKATAAPKNIATNLELSYVGMFYLYIRTMTRQPAKLSAEVVNKECDNETSYIS